MGQCHLQQQQILLIVLSVILVGIAIAVGITMFQSQAEQSNLDAIIADLNNLGAQAYQYRIRPESMGGGGGTYEDFTIPANMVSNANGAYDIHTAAADADESIIIRGWSATNEHGRQITVATDGTMTIQNTTDPSDDD
jgi:hypothetical protein